jgi:hypothetical protein
MVKKKGNHLKTEISVFSQMATPLSSIIKNAQNIRKLCCVPNWPIM